MKEREIFAAAVAISDPAERSAYLAQACAGQGGLQERIEELLVAHGQLGRFLEQPTSSEPGTADEVFWERLGTMVGPYKLLQKLGEGGMGSVYLAEQEYPVRRRVALKIIKAGLDSARVVARFEAERQALALMDHPHIARVLDAGATPAGRPYFVMELVKGIPITRYCDQEHLTPQERLELFVPVCQAVQHAHQKGIIHRDLKPSNVLIALYDGKAAPKVIDFGVAKAISQKLTEKTMFTEVGQMVGTLEYMAPEQAELNNLDIDTRVDIYSLGVILYELLTGTTPFTSKQLRSAAFAEMLRMIREVEPPRPSTKLSSSEELPAIAARRKLEPARLTRLVHGDLDWIVMKALAKDRGRRYATPAGFAEDVERYLQREAIVARPPSTAYKLKKFVQRHRGTVLAAGAVTVALLVGSALATWQAVVATRAKHQALTAAAAEQEAKDQALAKEAETEAVLDFVENKVFAAARPKNEEGGLGYDVQLVDALKAALPVVETAFRDRPLIEARLRMTMGNSFWYLGKAKIAVEQYEAARRLYAKQRGPDHPDTLMSMHNLATSYYDLGRHTEALKLHEQTLALRKARLGRDHPHTLLSMNNLASSYDAMGRHTDALKLNEETLALRKAKLGPDHLDTLGSMNNLAQSYQALGRYADAIQLYEPTLALMKAKIPDHEFTLRCMGNLAGSYHALGRYADALKLNEETLALRKAKLGPDHPDTLMGMNNLAGSYNALGRHAEALKLHGEALALRKAKLGADHPHTLMSMNNVASSYNALGRHADALKLREQALALRRAKLGPDHPDTLQGMHDLAQNYFALERYADALKLNEETLALRKAKLGPDHSDTLESMCGLAASLAQLHRGAEALPIIDESLQRAAGKVVDPNLIPTLMDLRLRHFEQAGDAGGCGATAEMWEKLKRTDAESLYAAACFRSVTAAVLRAQDKSEKGTKEAAAEADHAMAWLRQAVAAGYRDAANLKKDKDLDGLRPRDDFKKLLAELEKAKPPGK
jgi:serine/threonine protein kinase/tetratricopeptide (TPR) repeat protein